MKKNPIVSILVSYYNDQGFLKEHISSVLGQTYPHWELILLNHASTDNSREIARSFDDPRIKHVDYPINIGAMGGLLLKECLKLATGEYIKFFSADDFLLPNGLETLVSYLEKHPEKDFAFGDVNYVDKNSKYLQNSWFKSRTGFSLTHTPQTALKCFFDGISIFPFAGQIIRRKALKDSYLNNNFILFFDINLWSNLMINGHQFGLIDTPIACYRIHPEQATALAKKNIVAQRSYFESEAFRELWFKNTSPALAQVLCADSPYVSGITDETDARFVLAEYLFRKHRSPLAYIELNNLFENPTTLLHISDRFHFTIRDLRALTAPLSLSKFNFRKDARIIGRNLSFLQLFYLLGYKVQKYLKFQKKKFKKNQEYSL